MKEITLFTPISYENASVPCCDRALEHVSNYFYLGGAKAVVLEDGQQVKLVNEEISWYTVALKVASYLLLLPIALILFAVNVYYHW